MFQTRIHGRGGQGVVTAAELLAAAAFAEGEHAQAFPSFGSERTGAPVVAYCRISSEHIRSREPISRPDALIIQDPTLLQQDDLFAGLSPDGFALINSSKQPADLNLGAIGATLATDRLVTVPATDLARTILGRPVPNSVLLGAFAALTELVSLTAVTDALIERFPGPLGERNVRAATQAYEDVRNQLAGTVSR